MKKITLLTAAVLIQQMCLSQTVSPTTEVDVDRFVDRSRLIEPGLVVYGVTWLSGLTDVISEFGAPTAVIAIGNNTKALIYGKGHTLVFEANELREVIIDEASTLGELSNRIEDHPFFDETKATLSPGYSIYDNLEKIKDQLDGRIDHIDLSQGGNPKVSYFENYASITLTFAQFVDHTTDTSSPKYVLMRIGIRMQ